jgi:hypothetical protein
VALVTLFLRQRRLCVVNRYLPLSDLSSAGVTVSISILNRGHSTESEVRLELDPKLQYHLLARSTSGISLSNRSNLHVDRVPKRSDATLILLVEGGDFSDNSVLSISSKDTTGKVYPSLDKVPYPPGAAAGPFLGLLLIFGLTAYLGYETLVSEIESDIRHKQALEGLQALGGAEKPKPDDPMLAVKKTEWGRLGWSETSALAESTLGQLYGVTEFPVTLKLVSRKGGVARFEVEIWNKSKDWLSVTFYFGGRAPPVVINSAEQVIDTGVWDALVPADSRRTFKLGAYLSPTDPQAVRASLSIEDSFGERNHLERVIRLDDKQIR